MATHLANQRDAGQRAFELIPQARSPVPDPFHEPFRPQGLQHRETDRRAASGAPSQVCPGVKRRDPSATAS